MPESSSPDISTVRNLLNTFILLQSHLRLYGEHNANIALASTRMLGFVERLLGQNDAFTIYVGRHAFMLGDGLLDRNNRNFEAFANRLFQHGIAALTMHKGVAAREIHTLLQLAARKPSETWDEGGMAACLFARNIKGLAVREMAEQDFVLEDGAQTLDGEDLRHRRSILWERFALSVLQGLHRMDAAEWPPERLSPSSVAAETNQQLREAAAADRETFARDASRFLLGLKHEKIRIYRAAAINKLADYVNQLSPELRRLFLENAFHLNLEADLAEGFISGLSDQVILEALRSATLPGSYTPPVVLKLLGRLASERGIAAAPDEQAGESDEDLVTARLKDIFRADDFDKYVPKPYQQALLSIIHRQTLPEETTGHLDTLKKSLEPKAVEQHLGDVLLEILRTAPDPRHAAGLSSNAIAALDFYIATKHYRKLLELFELSRNDAACAGILATVAEYLSHPRLVNAMLHDLPQLEPEAARAAWALVFQLQTPFVGPLLDRLGTEPNRATRLTYLKALLKLGAPCVAQATARLDDPRWFVVRNMLYLLRELGDPGVLPQIRRHLANPHPKISQEALRTCLHFKDAEAIPQLLKALGSKEEADLISAITLASLADEPRVVARLIELLHAGTLLNFNLTVRQAAVRSLATLAPRQALPDLAELLDTRSLIQNRQLDALKIDIIASLDKYPGQEPVRLLQAQARAGSPEIARAAEAALRRRMERCHDH